jgi:hypothetical protein
MMLRPTLRQVVQCSKLSAGAGLRCPCPTASILDKSAVLRVLLVFA